MGTQFEHIINPLATSTRTHTIAGNRFDDGENQRRRELRKMSGVERLQDVMKRMLEKGDVEFIRSTMQIHEDVFKHQVKELHQLYSVQKTLMEELRNKIDHIHYQRFRDDWSSREHSGSCSGDSTRNSKGLNLERLADAYASTKKGTINKDRGSRSRRHDHKSKNMIMDHDEDSQVELTLSIGGSQSKKRSKSSSPLNHKTTLEEINFSSSCELGREKESSDLTTTMGSSGAACDPNVKRSHWLFQSLKL